MQEEKIFNALKVIFKSYDTKTAMKVADNLIEDLNMLIYWLDENITSEYKLKKDNDFKKVFQNGLWFAYRIRN